jgi:hypothetical protein
MSVEQIEASIRALPPAERARLVEWLEIHRAELVSDASEISPDVRDELVAGDEIELSEAQTEEVLRRRREYDEHPERFTRMDKKSLDQMFDRVRHAIPR